MRRFDVIRQGREASSHCKLLRTCECKKKPLTANPSQPPLKIMGGAKTKLTCCGSRFATCSIALVCALYGSWGSSYKLEPARRADFVFFLPLLSRGGWVGWFENCLSFALKQTRVWWNEPKGETTNRHRDLLREGQTAKGAIPKRCTEVQS